MGDSLFTVDVVRDFMITKGGKVTNHELVTHFKRFLNDPSKKAKNREKFKEFVNTLATVKLDDRGEKVLVLKKKFRDGAPVSNPADIQERGPKHELHRPKAKIRKQEPEPPPEPEAIKPAVPQPSASIAAAAAAFEAAADPDEVFLPTSRHVPQAELPMEEGRHTPDQESYDEAKPGTSHVDQSEDYGERPLILPAGLPPQQPVEPLVLGPPVGESSSDDIIESQPVLQHPPPMEAPPPPPAPTPPPTPPPGPPPVIESETPPGDSSTDTSLPVVESPEVAEEDVIEATVQQPTTAESKNSVSVKDRAKHLNKMSSESDLLNVSKVSTTESQGRSYDDSSSVASMDAAQRDWMITTATAEYHAINKLLLQNPQFVRRKDFVTGFTALHWAAKHGKAEVVKLLCGQPGAQNIVNIQSHGGYTPLHLASMHGHEDIITLLVKVYDADPHIRDYSGKMPKHYMRNCSSTTAHSVFRRQPSISAKSQRFGFYGIPAGAALANSWGNNAGNGPSRSPSPSPRTSPQNSRKSSSFQDENLMPPPKVAPKRKKKGRSEEPKRASSDTEMDMHTVSDHPMPKTKSFFI